MDRITISLPDTQMTWLKDKAKHLGITVGEYIRRLVDQVRDGK